MGAICCCGSRDTNNFKPNSPVQKPIKKDNHQTILLNPKAAFAVMNPNKFLDEYKLLGKLGSGSYGQVYRCCKKVDEKQIRAVKVILKKETEHELFIREADSLREINHPNIIQIFEIFEDSEYYYLVQEYFEGLDLIERITSGAMISESFIANVMHEILKAIAACHEKNICHRDLKLENLLIDKVDKQVKLIDFGLAEKFDPEDGIKGYFGTLEYLAPEVAIKRGSYTEKCDMWSLGVIMYAMLTKKFPFTNKKRETFKIRAMIQEGRYDTDSINKLGISPQSKQFLNSLLTVDPVARISAKKALVHPWLVENYTEKAMDFKTTYDALDSLRCYQQTQKFHRIIFSFISTQLSSSEDQANILEAEEVFRHLNKKNNGKMSSKELVDGFTEYFGSATQGEMEAIFYAADLNKDGYLDIQEWKTAMLIRKGQLSEKKLDQAFDFFDKDHCGVLHLSDLKEIIAPTQGQGVLREEVWERLFKEVIPDNATDETEHDCHDHGSNQTERTITRDQFKNIMKSTVKQLNLKGQ